MEPLPGRTHIIASNISADSEVFNLGDRRLASASRPKRLDTWRSVVIKQMGERTIADQSTPHANINLKVG
eukprot:6208707-Pleurochrysis_carterae.AAC.3